MTFTTSEIREVYRRKITGIRTAKHGMIPLSMCDREKTMFSEVRPLTHGFMMRNVIKLRKKSPVKTETANK